MKSIKKYIMTLGVAAAALTMGSCTDDLDLQPIDPSSINSSTFAEDPEGYMNRVLAEVYISFVNHGPNNNSQVADFDGGMSSFQRAIFNLEEIPTDEACWMGADDAPLVALSYGNISSDNTAIFGTYSRLIINVALCNSFIQTVEAGQFNLPADLQEKAADGIRQCKILRSFCYFHLISLFGDVPYADETVGIGTNAPQLKRAEIYDLVVKTLEDVVAEYGTAKQTPAYGYCGKDFAQGLLVRFYLNAEVFKGQAAWDKCLAVANDIIAAHKGNGFQGSGLAENYTQNFAANNDQITLGRGNVGEIFWATPASVNNLLTYGSSTLMILGAMAKTDELLAYFNVGNGWKCFKGRKQMVDKFEWNEPTQATSPDTRVMLWQTSKDGYVNENPDMNQNNWNENGYQTNKYINRNILADGTVDLNTTPGSDGDGYTSVAYPMMRLAEIYLSAAEAILHGAGAKNTALEYVNYIRERAGLTAWTENQLTLETLQDERAREMYQENTRRTDLIRYGKWISGYNWSWKNNIQSGTNFPDYYNVYPIPAQIIAQSDYQQNPQY